MLPKYRPPIHPGEVLHELFIEPAGLTQVELAEHLGWTKTRLNQIIRGKRAVTPESALALADALGTTPDVWLDMQKDFDLWRSQQKHQILPRHPKTLPQAA